MSTQDTLKSMKVSMLKEGAQDTLPPLPDRAQIREIFMRNGFTVKDGQTDLKDYVYDAAEELVLAAIAAQAQQALGVPTDAIASMDTFRPVRLEFGVAMHRDVRPNELGWLRRQDVLDALLAAAPQAEPAIHMTEAEVDEYLEEYEWRGEDADGRDTGHTPSQFEVMLIKDAIMGLLSEPVQAQGVPTATVEAIKTALLDYENAVDGVLATQEGDDPHAAALAVQAVEKAQEVLKTWAQPAI